jgi:hypothetical protein
MRPVSLSMTGMNFVWTASVNEMRHVSLSMTGMNLVCIYGCATRVIFRTALRYKTSEQANSE